ncbi:unnamed protein product [Heterobilharzia americana]|nr:unnamed protein product [Heterobilharzia americana]
MLSAKDFYRSLCGQGELENTSEGISSIDKLDTLYANNDPDVISFTSSKQAIPAPSGSNTAKDRRRVVFGSIDDNDSSCGKLLEMFDNEKSAMLVNSSNSVSLDSELKVEELFANEMSRNQQVTNENNDQYSKIDLFSTSSEYVRMSAGNLLTPLERGELLIRQMLRPTELEKFFSDTYQKTPLYVEHPESERSNWMSLSSLQKLSVEESLVFGQHVDLIESEGLRHRIVNPPGRALAGIIWDHFQNRGGLRFHNLQAFFRRIRFRLGLLQEYFGCNFSITANLFPSQPSGFVYRGINSDVFILQQEGSQVLEMSRYSFKNDL